MRTATAVFRKLKEMSKKTLNSRHRIFLNDIAAEVSLPPELLSEMLTELEQAGLIQIHKTTVIAISLTGYGLTQEDYKPPAAAPPSL